jgi:hypothetical protein
VVEALLGEAEAVGEFRVVVGGGLELPSQRGAELGGERRLRELGGVDLQGGGRGVGVGLGGITAESGAELRGERDRRGRVGVGLGDEEAGRRRRRESGGRHRRWIDRRRCLCSEGKRVFGVEGRRGVGNAQCPSTKMPLVFSFSDFLLFAFPDSVNSVAQFGEWMGGMRLRLALSVLLYHAHASFFD